MYLNNVFKFILSLAILSILFNIIIYSEAAVNNNEFRTLYRDKFINKLQNKGYNRYPLLDKFLSDRYLSEEQIEINNEIKTAKADYPTGYIPINRNSYGYRHYAVYLGGAFHDEVNKIARKHGFDANELLAMMHHESLFNPSAFNINWYVVYSGGKYYPSGDGGVGILQFSKDWIAPYHPYQFSNLNRVLQLQVFDKKLSEMLSYSVEYRNVINIPGGLCYIIMGRHRGMPHALRGYITNPYLGHGGALYFTNYPTSYNGGNIIKYDYKKRNFNTYAEEFMKIEKDFYKKQYHKYFR